MTKATFNGTNKIISIDSGITSINVQVDLYSDWKEWVLLSDNSKYLAAFRSVCGYELQSNYYLAPTFFLLNGWRIRPAEENHTLVVNGNIFVDGSTDSPFISTIGNYRVMVNSTTSNVVNTIATGSGVTAQDKIDIIDGVAIVGVLIDDVDKDDIVDRIATVGVLIDPTDKTNLTNEIHDAIAPDLLKIMGLMHQNFRFSDQVYNTDGNLVSAKVYLYSDENDCQNEIDPIFEYIIESEWNVDKKLTNYKMYAG